MNVVFNMNARVCPIIDRGVPPPSKIWRPDIKLRDDIRTKKRFNSGIAQISQTPPHPPIRATLPTLSAVATIDETFSLSKKSVQKNSGKGNPPPQNSGNAWIETFL